MDIGICHIGISIIIEGHIHKREVVFSEIQTLVCDSIVYWTGHIVLTYIYMESVYMLIDPAVCVFVTGAAWRVKKTQEV